MTIGLYLITPIIKYIVKSEKFHPFLKIGFIFSFVIPTLLHIIPLFSTSLGDALEIVVENMNVNLTGGYVFYYVLGYFLHETTLQKGGKISLYIGGIIGTLSTIVLTSALSTKNGYDQTFYSYFSVTVLFEAVSLFYFVKQHTRKNYHFDKVNQIITVFSKNSFGIYLIHPLYIRLIKSLGLLVLPLPTVFTVPLISLSVLLLSLISSVILKRIPFIKHFV